jgi:S1-C subfamily serine protease
MSLSFADQFPGLSGTTDDEGVTGKPVDLDSFYAVFMTYQSGEDKLFAFPAKVEAIAADRRHDLAACRISRHAAFPQGYPSVEIADHSKLRQGDDVMTLGFPLGTFLYDQLGTVTASLTRGVISAVVPCEGCDVELASLYQLDLTATNGNSGGPVFLKESGLVFGVLQGGVVHTNGNVVQGLTRAEPVYPMTQPDVLQQLKVMRPPGHGSE